MNKIAVPRRPPSARASSPARRPSPGLEEEIVLQARELDATFKALARKVLVDDDPASELPLRQFRVCAALFEGPRTMKQLSRELGVSQSAVTQLADRLEAAGMVTRCAAGGDRRVRSLELTPRARKLMQIRQERRVQRIGEILVRLAGSRRESVLAAFAALKDAVPGDEC